MNTPLDSFIAALERFSSSDVTACEEAFSVLTARTRPVLQHLLYRKLRSEQDREDVVEEVFLRIWRSRERLEFPTLGSWWRFVRTAANRVAIDHARRSVDTVTLDDREFAELPATEVEWADRLMEIFEDRRMLYRLADEVFLGLADEATDEARTHRLLAAKLYVVDRMPWKQVCRLVNANAPDAEHIGRSDLDRILRDPGVIRHLVYSELHWENEELCDYLLGVKPRSDWTEPLAADGYGEVEILAIQLRFRHILLLEQIVNRLSTRLKKSELIAIFDSCVRRFPFVFIMNRLIRNSGHLRGAWEQFAAPGLWQRLSFQYCCHNGLPHKDIHDRVAPAAELAGCKITLTQLNVGLSHGRLYKRLAEHLARTKTDARRERGKRI